MYDGRTLLYMTHMHNAACIAVYGALSKNKVAEYGINKYSLSIADQSVNHRRHQIPLDGKNLHDFVPLYWATHTPMQYVITKKVKSITMPELVFFQFDSQSIFAIPGVISTDGNAASSETKFYYGNGAVPFLEASILLNNACYSKEYKRKKSAEVLVPNHLSPQHMIRINTYNEQATNQLALEIKGILQMLHEKDGYIWPFSQIQILTHPAMYD